jgi:anti-sigma B factor antagonist
MLRPFSVGRGKGSPDCVVLHVCGELDLATSPALSEAIDGVVAEAKSAVLDLSACEFIDSSGIALLVHGSRRFERAGLLMRVVIAPGSVVERQLAIVGLTSSRIVSTDRRVALREIEVAGPEPGL